MGNFDELDQIEKELQNILMSDELEIVMYYLEEYRRLKTAELKQNG